MAKTFTPPGPRLYRVSMPEDSRIADLELVVEGSTVGGMAAFREGLSLLDGREGRWAVRSVAELIAPKLVSWNHALLPADLDGLCSFEYDDLWIIIREYASAVVGVGDPLDPPSPAFEQSAEDWTQMETSLGSLSH